MINNPIILGKLGSAYGISGWLRIWSYTENPQNIFAYKPWFILRSSGDWQQLELENWQYHNKHMIIKIKHVDDRCAANLITNSEIIVDSAQFPVIKDNEYYWKDLLNSEVITTQGYSLGYVQYLMETGSNDVLVIKANLKDTFGIKERLLPFLENQVIKSVNLKTKQIKVMWDPSF